ncbi:MAG: winged helix-turn-helix transcriptional regulator [Deltaproteobacteria bacterium]|nr:winged helix-turn-helix transcriptional regulator [Deltaproteobacteria bacterium]
MTTVAMSNDATKFFEQKNRDKLRWDMDPCSQAGFDDISGLKLKAFLKGCGLKHDNIPNALEKLNLVKDGKLLNTAVLCFAKKPEKFFPNARLRCAVFGATDTTVTLDMKDFYGDVFTLIRQADEYILEHINIGMRVEGLLRVDVPEINREAFREAIINAFCHRDYREYDSVNIAIFKDRVEIRNPGRLYGGLTMTMIREKMVSVRRNELLAELFHRVHFIEKWGRGVRMILEREPETEFEDVGGLFIATFKRKIVESSPEDLPGPPAQIGSQKGSQKIIELIKENSRITIKELAESQGISDRAVKMNLAKLKAQGILKRIGPDRGGHWEIEDNKLP